jgi:hypothetical protein
MHVDVAVRQDGAHGGKQGVGRLRAAAHNNGRGGRHVMVLWWWWWWWCRSVFSSQRAGVVMGQAGAVVAVAEQGQGPGVGAKPSRHSSNSEQPVHL